MSATRAGGSRPQAGVHVGDRGEPVLGQLVDEHRPVEGRDALARVDAVVRVGDALAGAEGRDHLVDRLQHADRQLRHGAQVHGAVPVQQRLAVLGGHRVAARVRRRRGVVDRQHAGDGLLLEPLARVALVHAGAGRQLGAGAGAVGVERRVQPQARADVHGGQLQAAEERLESALDEGLRPDRGGGGWSGAHWRSSPWWCRPGSGSHHRPSRVEGPAPGPGPVGAGGARH